MSVRPILALLAAAVACALGALILGEYEFSAIVRNGFNDIKVTFSIDADAPRADIEALVAQSQKRSAVFDALTNPTNVTVEVA